MLLMNGLFGDFTIWRSATMARANQLSFDHKRSLAGVCDVPQAPGKPTSNKD